MDGLGDTINTLKIEKYGITKYTPYGETYVTVNESALPNSILPKWKGLKILTLGDSITAMGGVNGWTYWIKQYLLADKVINEGLTTIALDEIAQDKTIEKRVASGRKETEEIRTYKYIQEYLCDKLSTKVRVTSTKVIIDFSGLEDFNRIMEILGIEE